MRRGDLVVLHDPQTAGLVPALRAVGRDRRLALPHRPRRPDDSALARRGWSFLEPYLREAHATVFSRRAVHPGLLRRRDGRA